jgi:hypothetical protein
MYEPTATNADNPTYGKEPSNTSEDLVSTIKKALETTASTAVAIPALSSILLATFIRTQSQLPMAILSDCPGIITRAAAYCNVAASHATFPYGEKYWLRIVNLIFKLCPAEPALKLIV